MYRNGWRGESIYKEKYINKTDSCWLWVGQKCKLGYGYTRQWGRRQAAHRYIYKLYVGDIPVGYEVMHICDVRNCVNPKHLRVGTHSENIKDMYLKGRRNNFGKNNPNYKDGKHCKSK